MSYRDQILEIISKAERVNKICEDLKISGPEYGRGAIDGASEDGVQFRYYAYGDLNYYSIPFEWLEMEETVLIDFLITYDKEQNEREREKRESKKKEDEKRLLELRKRQYEALKKEFGE